MCFGASHGGGEGEGEGVEREWKGRERRGRGAKLCVRFLNTQLPDTDRIVSKHIIRIA